MGMEVRTITDDELDDWYRAVFTGFHDAGDATPDLEKRRQYVDVDRTWAGFDGNRVVSTFRSFASELTLPGGAAVPASAITAVTTTATHRRRGLASQMMRGDLLASKEKGEAVAMLIAAEWPIYGRYGFGPATERQTWQVNAAAGRVTTVPAGSVEIIHAVAARDIAAELFKRHRAQTPGEIARPDYFFDLEFGILRFASDDKDRRDFFCAVARDPAGAAIGLLRYEINGHWEHWTPQSSISAPLFLTVDPRAEALLWNHLISMDHIVKVEAELRGVHETLPWILSNARHAVAVDRGDFLWIRPLDVPAVLGARSYVTAGSVVLEVVDPQGLAGGRFRVETDPDGASCQPTQESAELTLGMTQLSAVSLGGFPLSGLAAAGLVDEHAAGAAARADLLFRAERAPYCSSMF